MSYHENQDLHDWSTKTCFIPRNKILFLPPSYLNRMSVSEICSHYVLSYKVTVSVWALKFDDKDFALKQNRQ